MPDKNKANTKDRTGGRPLPSADKARKKDEAEKEERRGNPPRRLMHTISQPHASSRAAKHASMERYHRERTSLEVDPGAGRHYALPKQPTTTPYNQGVSLLDANPEQLTFAEAELARFVETRA
jgi:hypothetical protein